MTSLPTLSAVIYERLQHAFSPAYLEVVDESAQHHGHIAHQQGSKHFLVVLQADCLQSLSRVIAHQKIYAVLNDLMPHPLHALRITIKK
ncbi:MAG: hypothetical protein A3E83_04365 [Gammaproteobacteria bacterium RIFCSPHIGHO2_12_FULL_41_20]|nr:MAG: hypothetical protein A3E83_04365 [Gammaproteobacteria bacterium RIFCSPHIGHO2_12_FULL_41_20]